MQKVEKEKCNELADKYFGKMMDEEKKFDRLLVLVVDNEIARVAALEAENVKCFLSRKDFGSLLRPEDLVKYAN